MSKLWTSAEAVAATGGRTTQDWAATGVSIDTRSIEAGELFVALKDQRDGHDFVAMALEKGAAAALVSYVPDGVSEDAPLLIVDDVLAALEAMGRFARARTTAKVIGVTGSVGKTGTKEMLRTALAPQGKVHAAERSFNNHWGVPLTLARMPRETDFAVIEIGMNHPGEIGPLSRMADLDVAIITTVAAVHMAAFKSVDEIAFAKAEIFEGLRAGGVAVLNNDIATYPILDAAAGQATQITFGANAADFRLANLSIAANSTQVEAEIHGNPVLFKIGAEGRHLAMNALAVLAAAEASGADLAQAALALAQWHAPSGRGQRYTIHLSTAGETVELIDESYNANPTSMEAALDVLALSRPRDGEGRIAQGRRIAFLGDMLELGPEEQTIHANLSQTPAMAEIDVVHTAGPLMQALHTALPPEKQGNWYETATQMAQEAARLLDSGDVAMVKGSLGSKVGLVVETLKKLDQKQKEQGHA